MSPSGKAKAESKAGDAQSLAFARGSADQDASKPSSLPLRLSVARGGLGLEICEPVEVGPLVVDELEVALPGLNYPLDLSKGVKQFRNRRSALRHAVVRIDLEGLGRLWSEALRPLWGPRVRVRLRPAYEEESPAGGDGNNNDIAGAPSLAVTVYTDDAALAFDLVVTSGISPRVVIDAPRALGTEGTPLWLAMQAVETGLGAASSQRLSLALNGRAVEMEGLAEALALLVMPVLGCRLPQVKDQVVTRVSIEKGAVAMVLGARQEPFAAGRRALRVAGVADFLVSADAAVGQGAGEDARERYLEALEHVPAHPEVLQELAEGDLATGMRGESALSFLQELESSPAGPASSEARARLRLATAAALRQTGRAELGAEMLERYLEVETDPVLSALAASELAAEKIDAAKRRKLLDHAVARAPFLRGPRMARFRLALECGDFRVAASDAEQIEALFSDVPSRANHCVAVGRAYFGAQMAEDGQRWLRRALRLQPDHAEAMLELAESLATEQALRAAELFQAANRRLVEMAESLSQPADPEQLDFVAHADELDAIREMLSRSRFSLARILMGEDQGVAPALAELGGVETRSAVGVPARLMEAELYERSGNTPRRDSALSRLLEAVEMGWAQLGEHEPKLRKLLKRLDESDDSTLRQYADRVLAKKSS